MTARLECTGLTGGRGSLIAFRDVGVDGSPESRAAIEFAMREATRRNAWLRWPWVIPR